MRFAAPLVKGRLVKRYKRFLADVALADGEIVCAHCANSGSMLGLKDDGAEVWLSPAANPARKLAWTWELVRADTGALVGLNTALPNAIVAQAVQDGAIAELAGYENLRREVKYGRNSRIDLLLHSPLMPMCYVEVKSVTLKRGCQAQFPDAVTQRGTKHLGELAEIVAQGHRGVMVYLVQRDDCESFAIADDIDPAYGAAFAQAVKAGVEVICLSCRVGETEIKIDKKLPWVLPLAP